jgi:cytochrome c peroxidase
VSDARVGVPSRARRHVEAYAKDQALFFRDFAAAFRKLEELGVPFPAEAPTVTFARKA